MNTALGKIFPSLQSPEDGDTGEHEALRQSPGKRRISSFLQRHVSFLAKPKESSLITKDPYLKLVDDLEKDPMTDKKLVKHLFHDKTSSVYELSMLSKKRVRDTNIDFAVLSPSGSWCTLIENPFSGKESRRGSLQREHRVIDMFTCSVIASFKNCSRSYYVPGAATTRMIYISRNDCAFLEKQFDSYKKVFSEEKEKLVLYDIIDHKELASYDIPKSSVSLERRLKADTHSFTIYASFYLSSSESRYRTYSEHSSQFSNALVFGETSISNGKLKDWYLNAIIFKSLQDSHTTDLGFETPKTNSLSYCPVSTTIDSLSEFDPDSSLYGFLYHGGTKACFVGKTSQGLKPRGMLCTYEVELTATSQGGSMGEKYQVSLRFVRTLKQIPLPSQSILTHLEKGLHKVLYDPEYFFDDKLPLLMDLDSSNNTKTLTLLDCNGDQVEDVLSISGEDITESNVFGLHQECSLASGKNRLVLAIQQSPENKSKRYTPVLDIQVREMSSAHVTRNLKKIMLQTKYDLEIYDIIIPHFDSKMTVPVQEPLFVYHKGIDHFVYVANRTLTILKTNQPDRNEPLKKLFPNISPEEVLKEISYDPATSIIAFLYTRGKNYELYFWNENEEVAKMSYLELITKPEWVYSFAKNSFSLGCFEETSVEFKNLRRVWNLRKLPENMTVPDSLESFVTKDIIFFDRKYIVFGWTSNDDDPGKRDYSFIYLSFTEDFKLLEIENMSTEDHVKLVHHSDSKFAVIYSQDSFIFIDFEEMKIRKAEDHSKIVSVSLSKTGKIACITDKALMATLFYVETGKKIPLCSVSNADHFNSTFSSDSSLLAVFEFNPYFNARVFCLKTNRLLYNASNSAIQSKNLLSYHFLFDRETLILQMIDRSPNELKVAYLRRSETPLKVQEKGELLNLLHMHLNSYIHGNPEQKQAAAYRIKACYRMYHPLALARHHTLFAILSKLEDENIFTDYVEYVGISMLYHEIDLLNWYFQSPDLLVSRRVILQLTKKALHSEDDSVPIIDTEKAELFLQGYQGDKLKDDLCREMFLLLIQVPYKTSFPLQIQEDSQSAFRLTYQGKYIQEGEKIEQVIDERITILKQREVDKLDTYQAYRSLCKVDISNGSRAAMNFFNTLDKMSDNDIQARLKPIIYLKWMMIQPFVFVYSCLFWVLALLCYFFFGFFSSTKGLGVTICILNILFLSLEIKCFVSQGFRAYMTSIWNFIDILLQVYCFILSMIMISATTIGFENQQSILILRIIVLILVWVRAISWFRVFRGIRHLLTMCWEVFFDVMPFLLILVTSVLGFSFIWRLTEIINDSTEDPPSFYDSFYDIVFIIFGNGSSSESDGSNYGVFRFVVIVIINAILALVLLNFLIAIISGTHDRISDNRDLYDLKELMVVIQDFNSMLDSKKIFTPKSCYLLSLVLVDESQTQVGSANKAHGSEERNRSSSRKD